MLQLHGDFLTRGFAPRPSICPQTHVIGSRYRARHGAVTLDIAV